MKNNKTKKIGLLLATIFVLTTLCVLLCGCYHGRFFDKDHLEEHLVRDLPKPYRFMWKHRGTQLTVRMTENKFQQYVEEVYEYLLSCNFQRFGTRGEVISGLIGMQYAVRLDTENLSDFLCENTSDYKEYIYIWADETSERDGHKYWVTHYIEMSYGESLDNKLIMNLCHYFAGYKIVE